jgi:hypothetical protein
VEIQSGCRHGAATFHHATNLSLLLYKEIETFVYSEIIDADQNQWSTKLIRLIFLTAPEIIGLGENKKNDWILIVPLI